MHHYQLLLTDSGILLLTIYMSNKGSKCEVNRRGFTFRGIIAAAAAGASVIDSSLLSQPAQGSSLPFT